MDTVRVDNSWMLGTLRSRSLYSWWVIEGGLLAGLRRPRSPPRVPLLVYCCWLLLVGMDEEDVVPKSRITCSGEMGRFLLLDDPWCGCCCCCWWWW